MPSPLVPSPALSKAGTKGELLGGQRAGAGGSAAALPTGLLLHEAQNLAVFQASPLLSSPEHQNQRRVL